MVQGKALTGNKAEATQGFTVDASVFPVVGNGQFFCYRKFLVDDYPLTGTGNSFEGRGGIHFQN